MEEVITILIISVCIGGVILIEYFGDKKLKGIEKENKLRHSDEKLQKFYYEMNTDRNDGWTKSHYKLLYEQRLKELKNK
jgi:hypothetical protein